MSRRVIHLAAALAVLSHASAAVAQTQPCAHVTSATTANWTAPLARRLTLQLENVTLRDALDDITARSGIRLSYSADMLPLERRVCITAASVPLGDILSALLRQTGTHPVSAAADHAAIAPDAARTGTPEVIVLEPVYAAIDAAPTGQRVPGVRVVVLDEVANPQPTSEPLAVAVNHGAPGMWLWQQPHAAVVQYGSLRGASSFGAAAPKLYVDGIEIANPLLFSRISPDAIERIEIVRGPQGGALYGADATGGVMNIVTRRGAGAAQPRTQIRSSVGLAGSDYAAGSAARHEHAISTRMGDPARSLSVSVAAGGTAGLAPQTGGEFYTADASGRITTARAALSGTFRFMHERTAAGRAAAAYGSPSRSTLAVQQYTMGTSVTVTPSATWTHTAILGIDGYALAGLPALAPWASDAERALSAAGESGYRTTARLNTTARRQLGSDVLGSLSLALEHTQMLQRGAPTTTLTPLRPVVVRSAVTHSGDEPLRSAPLTSQSSTGVGAQALLALSDRLSLMGAVRLEHGSSDSGDEHMATLPMIGGSYVVPLGRASLGLRASHGKAIRWVQQPQSPEGGLIPEAQTGMEAGFDLTLSRTLALHVTRFDQTATSLMPRSADTGVIDNSGWELEMAVTRGALSLALNGAVVDSRVERIAGDYSGDLRAGDRMLGVPRSTLGVTASWSASRWSLAVGAARANDWINYDRMALARAGIDVDDIAGAKLRSFWRAYDGITHLSVRTTHMLSSNVWLILGGENLLDRQTGEPDNITILPGRGLSVGVRANF